MSNWLIGLEAVMQVQNLLLIVAGVLIGIVVGALPGISATVGIAILLPFTFVMEPLSGMMLLLGIYGGAVYAGSIPAVLVRAPGTPASAASVADGNALARQGRGDEAFLQFEKSAKLKLGQRSERFRPNLSWLSRLAPSSLLGSAIGFIIGIIPGTGGDVSAFVAYNEAKRWARKDRRFGNGDTRGLVAAETAKNAGTAGALVPTLTLGIPGDVTSAVLIGAITVHGLQPGPRLFTGRPDLIYGIFVGFLLVYLVLLVLGWLGTRAWTRLIENVPNTYLWPTVVVLSVIGSYALRSNPFDVLVMLVAACVGYVFIKTGFPLAPLIIGMILGPLAEGNFRRAMIISGGELSWMWQPLPLTLLILTVVSLGFAVWREIKGVEHMAGEAEPEPEEAQAPERTG